MTATTTTTAPTETHAELFARRARETRDKLPHTDTQTRAMNGVLDDIKHFDRSVQTGALYTFAGHLEQGLSCGGLKDVAFDGTPVAEVREHIRAYAEWLMLVANNAQ